MENIFWNIISLFCKLPFLIISSYVQSFYCALSFTLISHSLWYDLEMLFVFIKKSKQI